MLIIIFGTSCAGKTTLIKQLCKDENFQPIMCHTTRPKREADFARTTIPDEQFEEYRSQGKFRIINEHLNAKYGNLHSEFDKAQNSKNIYFVIDYMIKDFNKFNNLDYIGIVLNPKDREVLLHQIGLSGRSDRKEAILKDYESNYSEKKLLKYEEMGLKVIRSDGNITLNETKLKTILNDLL